MKNFNGLNREYLHLRQLNLDTTFMGIKKGPTLSNWTLKIIEV